MRLGAKTRETIRAAIGAIAGILFAFFILSGGQAFGQTNGALLPALPPQFQNAANGKLCTQAAGTTTALATYSDAGLTSALPTVISLNALGRPTTSGGTETAIYMQARAYKISLYGAGSSGTCNGQAVGALVWTRDHVYDIGQLLLISNNTWTGTNTFEDQIFTSDGLISAPGIASLTYPTSGFSWYAGNSPNLVVSIAGTSKMIVNSYGVAVNDTLEGPAARLHISSDLSVPFAWTTAGIVLRSDPATYTDQVSSGVVGAVHMTVFDQPTIAASSATTYTNAVNFYIQGPPIAGTNVTITNPYALYVGSGAVVFPGVSWTSSGLTYAPSGSASAPSYAFDADHVTGAYRAGVSTYAIATSGGQAVNWNAAHTQTNAGGIVTTFTGPNIFIADSGTTGGMLLDFANTGGQTRLAVESSAGGSTFSGSSAYATVFGSIANTSVQFFSHNTLAMTISTNQSVTFAQAGIFQQAWGIQLNTSSSPAHTDACAAGSFAWDSGFIYVCAASGDVRRVAIATY